MEHFLFKITYFDGRVHFDSIPAENKDSVLEIVKRKYPFAKSRELVEHGEDS